jgi:ABC-2 type transport system permease protein
VQLFLAVGIVYGLAYLLPRVDARTAMYLSTGAPTLTLLILGLTVVPSEVAQDRISGHHEYVAALPVGRLAQPLAGITFWVLSSAPGMALSMLVASLRFHFQLHPSLLVLPAVALVSLTAAAVGYAIAAVVRPQVVQQLTSFLSVLLLLFSPVNFPIGRLPGWLQDVHRVLPIRYMADLVRYTLAGPQAGATRPVLAFAVVGAWCAVALAVTSRVAVTRR